LPFPLALVSERDASTQYAALRELPKRPHDLREHDNVSFPNQAPSTQCSLGVFKRGAAAIGKYIGVAGDHLNPIGDLHEHVGLLEDLDSDRPSLAFPAEHGATALAVRIPQHGGATLDDRAG
jgi:hypothetical protein